MTWVQQTRGTDAQPYTVWVLEIGDGSRLVADGRTGFVCGSDGTGGWLHIHHLRGAGLVTATYHGPEAYGDTTYHAVVAA